MMSLVAMIPTAGAITTIVFWLFLAIPYILGLQHQALCQGAKAFSFVARVTITKGSFFGN